MSEQARRIVESGVFQNAVLALILVNAAVLGAETLPVVKRAAGGALLLVDRVIIYAFTAEIALRLVAYRASYFRSGWNVFDFIIVAVSLFAAQSGLGAIRAFRVLRVLRVVTVIPRMRTVVSGLLNAIPGVASVGVLLVIILYVFAVIAANLYGGAHPDLFGDVFRSMYTLFQVMTLENWPDVAGEIAETHERSWIFFVAFLLVATFTMLNLFVAIIVRVIDEDADPRLDALRAEIAELKTMVADLAARDR